MVEQIEEALPQTQGFFTQQGAEDKTKLASLIELLHNEKMAPELLPY